VRGKERMWPRTNPGERNQKIVFLQQSLVNDISGTAEKWLPASPPHWVWGKVRPGSGTDAFRAGQEVSKVPVEIEISYDAAAVANMRVQVPSGHIFVVRAIQNVNLMNIDMVLTCEGLSGND
jgi:SPP1 family predicted phage head-tail adaptor